MVFGAEQLMAERDFNDEIGYQDKVEVIVGSPTLPKGTVGKVLEVLGNNIKIGPINYTNRTIGWHAVQIPKSMVRKIFEPEISSPHNNN